VDKVSLALLESKRRPARSEDEEQYKIEGNRVWYRGLGGWQPLGNFVATIEEEVIPTTALKRRASCASAGACRAGRTSGWPASRGSASWA
jgi:hypothetical protein